MKICSKCKENKSLDSFAWKSKAKGTLSPACKECHRSYSKKHYSNNTEKYLAKAKVRNEAEREKCRVYIIAHLKQNPCVECGEDDIDVLEFDHLIMVGSAAKRVSNYVGEYQKMLDEIAKCQVLCANCHVRRTRKMMGTTRTLRINE